MTGATWPRPIDGVTESVMATEQPDGTWNQAALGLRGRPDHEVAEPVTARTWGETRTKRNLERTGEGVVQFVDDPVRFVEAALGILETDAPVLDEAAAWVAVEATRDAEGHDGGTAWIEWELRPTGSELRRRSVPSLDRGRAAVVEMTVAASRLDVPAYDTPMLRERLAYFADVVGRCGTRRDRQALDRIAALTDWRIPDPDGNGSAGDRRRPED